MQFGARHGVGIECGSKPELQAVLALTESTDHLIVCNGYKDEEFMHLALMGQKLGHQVFIVIEQEGELDVLLRVADEMGVTPQAGIRIKLASEGYGRWAESGGEKSKFGLSASELVRVVDKLRDAGRLDVLKLIHFHLGSQITDIRYIKSGLQEVARFYAELHAAGVRVSHVDVGGGLGIDYDGSGSTVTASVNYSVQEYANDVVYTLAEMCRELEIPMPNLISESGRALTAHHALLLLNVIDVESQQDVELPLLTDDDHTILHDLQDSYASISVRSAREVYHDATFAKERAQALFNSGVLSLRARAMAEQLYTATVNAVAVMAQKDREEYEDIIEELEARLIDRYFCNFSVFQSLPDSWAIDQIFPIIPIHRLDEEPERRGTHPGCHVRFRRKDRPLRGRQARQPESASASVPAGRAVHPRNISHRRVPGNPRRPAQSVRRHERRARAALGVRLRGDRSGARRHGDRGAELRAVPRVRPADDVQAKGLRRDEHHAAGGEHVHRGLRRRTRGIHLSRGRRGAAMNGCALPRVEALRYLRPVHHVPPRGEIVGSTVLVLQVVRVLPHVDAENRSLLVAERRVLIG